MPVPSVEFRVVPGSPGLAKAWRIKVPVGTNFGRRRTEVTPEVVDRWPTPEPVTVVDAVDEQPRA